MYSVTLLYIIIGANILVHFLPFIRNFSDGPVSSRLRFMQMGWKSNTDIDNGEYYRLLTSTFLHGGEMHLFINMYSLWNVGGSILFSFGSIGFLILYFLSGIGGSLLSYWFNPKPSVGASGAIFGLIGALLALAFITQSWGLLRSLTIIIAINLSIAFVPGTRLDNWGHIGGLISGFIISLILLFSGIL